MAPKITWQERINMLSINPDAATRDDVARLASELGLARKRLIGLGEWPEEFKVREI